MTKTKAFLASIWGIGVTTGTKQRSTSPAQSAVCRLLAGSIDQTYTSAHPLIFCRRSLTNRIGDSLCALFAREQHQLKAMHWIRIRLSLISARFLTLSILWSMIHLDLDIEMCQRLVPSFSPCTDAILPHVHPVCIIFTQIIVQKSILGTKYGTFVQKDWTKWKEIVLYYFTQWCATMDICQVSYFVGYQFRSNRDLKRESRCWMAMSNAKWRQDCVIWWHSAASSSICL